MSDDDLCAMSGRNGRSGGFKIQGGSNADAAAKTLSDVGFEVSKANVDISSRASVEALVEKAISLGKVFGVIHAAGVSPSQALPE